jgi:hypothetical protein
MTEARHFGRKKMKRVALFVAAALVGVSSAQAELVRITTTGVVDYNVIGGSMAGIPSGAPVSMSFDVDSAVFTDSVLFPTRGYHILLDTFSMTVNGVAVPIVNPQTDGTAYFVLRNNDPAVDGFFISTGSVDLPFPVAVRITGLNPVHELNFSRTFNNGTPFPSLNILDCLGTYDQTNLSVYSWSIGRFGNNGAEYVFQQTTIAVVPEPASAGLLAAALPLLARRRRA